MIISYGQSASDKQPTRHNLTFEQLVDWLRGRFDTRAPGPKDGPYLSFADYGGGRRAYDSLVASWAVPLDLDLGQYHWTAEAIAERLSGYQYVAWTSYSHSEAAPRWRIVVPVERGMTADEHRGTWLALAALFAHDCGESSKDATRLNYLPGTCLHPEQAQFMSGNGAYYPIAAPVAGVDATPGAYTDGPVEGWAGPEDDDELIAYMLAQRSRAESAFGDPNAPTRFEALWTGDAATLAVRHPPSEPGQVWDHTAADLALANELAYYTGSDGERCFRLMERSALAQRASWRPDKATRAIGRACAGRTMHHFMRPAAARAAQSASNGPQLDLNANGIVQPDDFLAYLPKHEYIHRPTGAMWPAASLDATVGKDTRAMLDITVPVHALAWAPGRPERFQWRDLDATNEKAAHCWVYNRYQPPRVPRRNEDVTLWLNLLNRLYPKDAQHILMYLADAVQNPGTKCNHALVLGSRVHGIGKDTLLLPMHWAVGAANYRTIKPAELLGTYNPWVATRILQISESRNLGDSDGRVSKYEMYESTKDLCAAPPPTLACVDKYVARIEVANVLRLILTTNHEIDGLYLPPQDRRYYCAWSDAGALPEAESKVLYAWYAAGGDEAVAYYLAHLDISSFNRAAEPPRTEWWHLLVDEGNPHDANPVADAIEAAGNPAWLTADLLAAKGGTAVAGWLANPVNGKTSLSRALSKCGYRKLRNPEEKRGRWKINGKQLHVYALPGVNLTDVKVG
jgi:hypothetical protein